MTGRSYAQVDGGPSDVILELGRFRNPTPVWVWVVGPLIPCVLFGWLIFVLPYPLYATGPALLAMCVFTAAMLVISRKLPISALTDRGVQGRVSFAPWHEVLTYRFSDPNGLSLTVVGHVTFMPEIALELDCPPELREEALAVFREHAPTAKLLGRVPGTET